MKAVEFCDGAVRIDGRGRRGLGFTLPRLRKPMQAG
jgi:hypothetical protein